MVHVMSSIPVSWRPPARWCIMAADREAREPGRRTIDRQWGQHEAHRQDIGRRCTPGHAGSVARKPWIGVRTAGWCQCSTRRSFMNMRAIAAARILFIGTLMIAAACRSPSSNPDPNLPDTEGNPVIQGTEEITLNLGQDRTVLGVVLHVSFARVVSDSRCPVDVTCVWAGNGEVELGIHMGTGPTHPLLLNTMTEPKSRIWNNVRVTLLGLTPEPRTNPPHDTDAYQVRIRVEALQ
jgi:hypothetical protein